MTQTRFKIAFNCPNGGSDSLILADDPAAMNWIGGRETRGTLAGFEFVSCHAEGNRMTARYRRETCEAAVGPSAEADVRRERCTLRNTGSCGLCPEVTEKRTRRANVFPAFRICKRSARMLF